MLKYTGRIHTAIVIGALAMVAACGDKNKRADSALAADSALNRDLAMAGSDTAAQPALNDVPASGTKTTPSTTTHTPTSSSTKTTTTTTTTKTTTPPPTTGNTSTSGGAGGTAHTIPAGTTVAMTAGSTICTNTGHVGDTWTAKTSAPIVAGGARIPRGATVTMKVTQLKRSEHTGDNIIMAFDVESIRWGGKTYPISGNLSGVSVARVRNEPKSADVKKVLGGAAIGAIAGQVLGKSTKSTVIGAAAGAAVGAGAAATTANYEGCINSGTSMTLTLSQPLQVVAEIDRPRRRG
jgi:hypothetical protein